MKRSKKNTMVAIEIKEFDPSFATHLPETLAILQSAGLVAHPSVTQITLHGSRGLARTSRPDSDIDLSLRVHFSTPPVIGEQLGDFLREVVEVTSSNWRGPVVADLAVIFPMYPCTFACFQRTAYDPGVCTVGGTDCFGVYKARTGFVLNAGIQVERMYPCIAVWKSQKCHPFGL